MVLVDWRSGAGSKGNERRRAHRRIAGYDERPTVDALESRRLHHVIGRADGCHAPLMEQYDVAGEACNEVELVAHQEHGVPGHREIVQELEYFHLVADVEERG